MLNKKFKNIKNLKTAKKIKLENKVLQLCNYNCAGKNKLHTQFQLHLLKFRIIKFNYLQKLI